MGATFIDFKSAVSKQFDTMATSNHLFLTDHTKDQLWATYLASFPEGSDPIYKTNSQHNCQCCRSFINTCGHVVAITADLELLTIWDIDLGTTDDDPYQIVANAMAESVRKGEIADLFLHSKTTVGTDKTHKQSDETDGPVIVWDHFYHDDLPYQHVKPKADIPSLKGGARTSAQTFRRALGEIAPQAVRTVLDLIMEGKLYRGNQQLSTLTPFKIAQEACLGLTDAGKQRRFHWLALDQAYTGIRNSSIGTLLQNLTADPDDIMTAVGKYEAMVSPENYMRSTASVSSHMLELAKQTVTDLGLMGDIQRRHATMADLNVNNMLFIDRDTDDRPKQGADVFDQLIGEAAQVNLKTFEGLPDTSIASFIADILPTCDSVEVLLQSEHRPNLVSLITSDTDGANNLFSWDNNFSWSYNGEYADSITERVAKAGGNVDGVLRCSLGWYNDDDLDVRVTEPCGNTISFNRKANRMTSGALDVDMHVSPPFTADPVENIVWTDGSKIGEGEYHMQVHNYTHRNSYNIGFECVIVCRGTEYKFRYEREVRNNEFVSVAKFRYSRQGGITLLKDHLPVDTGAYKTKLWALPTQQFHKVRAIMNSPNHWNSSSGNKHFFFMLEGCVTSSATRGFYNEFLNPELYKHRKAFELLGSKTKVEPVKNELSGLGFSDTKRATVICRVRIGTDTKVFKVRV